MNRTDAAGILGGPTTTASSFGVVWMFGAMSLFAACKPNTGATAPDGEVRRPTFDAAVMDGWTCRVSHDSTLGPEEGEFHVTTTVDFTVVAEQTGLALLLHDVEQVYGVTRSARRISLDESRITIVNDGEVQSQAASEHPDVRRVIEAVTGAPRLRLEIDARAKIVRQRGRLDPVAKAMFTGLGDVGAAWMFGFPELPSAIQPGRTWQGLRSRGGSPRVDERLDYRVERIEDGVAFISIHAESDDDLPAGLRARRIVDGTAQVRTRDAAYLGSDILIRTVFRDAAPDGERPDARIGLRTLSRCEPGARGVSPSAARNPPTSPPARP